MKSWMAAYLAACAICISFASAALGAMPSILHQSEKSVIVRMAADEQHVVWQVVGSKKEDASLYLLDLKTGRKSVIKSKKRPFGPAIANGVVFYGAGKLHEKIDVMLHDIPTNAAARLHKKVPWIVEPAIQYFNESYQAIWERSQNDDGHGLAIYLYNGDAQGTGPIKIVADGPVLRKNEIPREYHRLVKNEYPEISGQSVAFQNDEYGTPNIYRLELDSMSYTRLSPSGLFQERPAIDGPYTAWEESELGFAKTEDASIYLHDANTGTVRRLNSEPGRHYQARIKAPFVVYGARREPAASTPSIRVFDLEQNTELTAHKCFPGPIFDWVPTEKGLFAAQKVGGDSSRLLFATWEQVRNSCK